MNRAKIGILLDLISFFLVTPEFLGSETLKSLEKPIVKGLSVVIRNITALRAAIKAQLSSPEDDRAVFVKLLELIQVPTFLVALILLISHFGHLHQSGPETAFWKSMWLAPSPGERRALGLEFGLLVPFTMLIGVRLQITPIWANIIRICLAIGFCILVSNRWLWLIFSPAVNVGIYERFRWIFAWISLWLLAVGIGVTILIFIGGYYAAVVLSAFTRWALNSLAERHQLRLWIFVIGVFLFVFGKLMAWVAL